VQLAAATDPAVVPARSQASIALASPTRPTRVKTVVCMSNHLPLVTFEPQRDRLAEP
jgi:hypothetical protein